jgi:signal transduction histidine kinase
LPVQAVHLYAREPEQNTVALIASNGNQGEAAARAAAALQPGNCVSCSYWWSPTASLQQCDFPASSASADQPISYCLTLAPQGDISAILRLFLPGNAQVAPEQLNRLVRFAPEMALAIKNVHLRHLVQSQSEAAEADRQRIARDLHDTLGQNLSYLRLKLDQISCQSSLQTISEIQNDIERMRDIANEAYAQMRGTLADLNLNSQIELETAIRAQANLVSERAKFRLELTSQGQTIALHSHTKRQLLYVCREALNNIEKHADARLVGICLDWGEQDLRITISDDGRGFDPEDTYRENHYGLAIMAERAAEINGRLSIHSKPGQGTQVVLYLPLPVAQSNLV